MKDYCVFYAYTWQFALSKEDQRESLKQMILLDYLSLEDRNLSENIFHIHFQSVDSRSQSFSSYWHQITTATKTVETSINEGYFEVVLTTYTLIEMVKTQRESILPLLIDIIQDIILDKTIEYHLICPIRMTCFLK